MSAAIDTLETAGGGLTLEDIVSECTFVADEIVTFDRDGIDAALRKHSFVLIRGLFRPEDVRRGYASLRDGFDASRDQPAVGEEPGAVMKNFQKMAVGGTMQSGLYRPRCIRTIYNPFWEEDIYGLHGLFRRLSRFRNFLLGKPLDFAIDSVEEALWTAARLHHYPSGGGFLVSHRDVVMPRVTEGTARGLFHQILLPLTEKGKHFHQGGGYVQLRGQRMMLEDHCELGDVVIYDGATVHGVQDIDPDVRMNLNTMDGRVVMFASLYRDMGDETSLSRGFAKLKNGDKSW